MKLTIDDILAEWKADNTIDDTKLPSELMRSPHLHSKYLEVFLHVKRKFIAATSSYNKLKYLRKKYFRGEMTREELAEQGWDQYQGLKMSQTEFNSMSEIDPILADEWVKVEYLKSLVDGLTYILKEIQNRGYTIKTMVEYNKMMMGG